MNDPLNAAQPPPVPNDAPAVWDLVVADMRARDAVGAERYGTRLQPNNGRDALVDAYQEALDLVVYLRQAIAERDAVRDTGHDRDGGRARSRVAGAARVRLLIDGAIARMAACSGNVLTLKLEPTGWRVWGASYATANNSPTAAVQTAAAVERWAAALSNPLPTGSGEFDRKAAAIAADLDLEGEGEP